MYHFLDMYTNDYVSPSFCLSVSVAYLVSVIYELYLLIVSCLLSCCLNLEQAVPTKIQVNPSQHYGYTEMKELLNSYVQTKSHERQEVATFI